MTVPSTPVSHSLIRNGDVEIAYRVVPQTGDDRGTGASTKLRHPGRVDRLAQLTALTLAQPTHASMVQKQAAVLDSHVADELGRLERPTMIIHGDEDPLVGHLPTWEAPGLMREPASTLATIARPCAAIGRQWW